jgi:hypothetical protein
MPMHTHTHTLTHTHTHSHTHTHMHTHTSAHAYTHIHKMCVWKAAFAHTEARTKRAPTTQEEIAQALKSHLEGDSPTEGAGASQV